MRCLPTTLDPAALAAAALVTIAMLAPFTARHAAIRDHHAR